MYNTIEKQKYEASYVVPVHSTSKWSMRPYLSKKYLNIS